jgi:hypothetical protein
MNFKEFAEAAQNAEDIEASANDMVGNMARLCVGRLRSSGCSSYVLCRLKRELAQWNMHTHEWKE